MDRVNLGELRHFLEGRPVRLKVFERPRMVCDLLCLEPEQSETRTVNEHSDAVYVVIEGEARMRVGPQSEDATALDAIVVPPQVEHSITNPGPGRLTILAFVAPNPIRASEPFNRQPRERSFGERSDRRPRMEGPRPQQEAGEEAGARPVRAQRSFPPRYDRPPSQYSGGRGRERPVGRRPFTDASGDSPREEGVDGPRPRTGPPGPGRPAPRGRPAGRPFAGPPRGRPRRDSEGPSEEGERRGPPRASRAGSPRGRAPARPFAGPPRGRTNRRDEGAPTDEGRPPRATRGAPRRDGPAGRPFSGPPRPAARRSGGGATARPRGPDRGPRQSRSGGSTSGQSERPGSGRSGPRTSGPR